MNKNWGLLLTLALIGCTDLALVKDNNSSISTKDIPSMLASSERSWNNLKKKHGANYYYDRDQSSIAGHNTTRIHIENDRVEYRDYFEWQTQSTPSLSWSEHFADLNTHQQGAPAVTIDQLYQQCKELILTRDPSQFSVHLNLDQFNVLQECSYVKLTCKESCIGGIRINALAIPAYAKGRKN